MFYYMFYTGTKILTYRNVTFSHKNLIHMWKSTHESLSFTHGNMWMPHFRGIRLVSFDRWAFFHRTDVQKTLVTSEGVETGWKVNVVSPVLLYFTNISNSGIQLGNLDVFWSWADYETASKVSKDETQDVKLLCRCRLNIIHVVITSVKTLWAGKQFCRRRRCAVTCSTSCKRPRVTSVETPVSESVPPCEEYYSMSIEAAARSDPRSKPPSRRLSANTLHLQPTSEPHMLPVQKQPEALWAPSQSFNKQSDCVPVEAQTRLQGMFDTRLHRVSKCS